MPYVVTVGRGLEYTNISYNLERQGDGKGLSAKSRELFLEIKFLLIYSQRPKTRRLRTLTLYSVQYGEAETVY